MRSRPFPPSSNAAVAMLLVLLATAAQSPAADEPQALIERMWKQFRSVGAEREDNELLVIPEPHEAWYARAEAEQMIASTPRGVIHKRAVRHVLYAADENDKLHLLFSLPPADAGLGFLVWRQAETAQDGMWLYMPGYRGVRRIPASSKRRLAGTDFLYEDVRALVGERTDRFRYDKEREEEIDGRRCDVVSAEPREGTTSAYTRRVLWIDTERLLPLKIEFHDARGLWKVLRNGEVVEAAPGVYRADLTEMRDRLRDQSTLLLVTSRKAAVDVPSYIFTQDYLVNPGVD